MIHPRETGGVSTVAAVRARGASTLDGVASVRVRDAGGLSTVWSAASLNPLVITVSPGNVYGSRVVNHQVAVTTEAVTVSVSGGQAPYTVVWDQVGSLEADWTILSPASFTTQFRRSAVFPGEAWSADFAATITDANGLTGTSDPVDAQVFNYGTEA